MDGALDVLGIAMVREIIEDGGSVSVDVFRPMAPESSLLHIMFSLM